MDTLLQQTINTLTMASVYGLFAVGFVLIFGVLDVLNLGYAFVFMITANIAVWTIINSGSLVLAVAVGLVSGAVLGLVLDFVAYRPVRGRGATGGAVSYGPLLSTLGIAGVLEAVAVVWFGTRNQIVPEDAFPQQSFHLFGATITLLQIVVIVFGIGLLIALHRFLRGTIYGRALRAVAENRQMATSLGINSGAVVTGVWVLSSMLAALAGVFIALVTSGVSTSMGSTYELKGFIVVVLGGMGSVGGAIVAALMLAVLETTGVYYLGGQFRDMIPLLAIVLILLIRPHGLLGRRARTV
ncbi:branched-chain amino acid ABC transporter permease [Acrocarpospora catenulata]|uniref:branched-chain amino acid ABC transporter permease n=1 Tax=Acrocarpospora catenulata TaxID=2836182 RepID=UPI001BD9429B|nr:branched-chain amino acid ABC transporter permease [Acrocarpospora catenulata]